MRLRSESAITLCKDLTDITVRDRIDEQSFTVNLRPLGEVTLPPMSRTLPENPLSDVVFLIEKEGGGADCKLSAPPRIRRARNVFTRWRQFLSWITITITLSDDHIMILY